VSDQHVAVEESWKEFLGKNRRIIIWGGVVLLIIVCGYYVVLFVDPPDDPKKAGIWPNSPLKLEDARHYCDKLIEDAKFRQILHLAFGWLLTLVAVLIGSYSLIKLDRVQNRVLLGISILLLAAA